MITVITPTYNSGKYIKDCMNGIKLQKDVRIKHIIIDSMSNDETEKYVNEYKKAVNYEVVYIREIDNNHLEAMNKGLKITDSEFVTVCNSSDFFCYDNFFSKAEKIMLGHDVISCVFGLIKSIDNVKDMGKPLESINRVSEMLNSERGNLWELRLFLNNRTSWNETGTIFRTEVLKDVMIDKMNNIHPWLDIVRNFYMTTYVPYFIENIVSCCLNHSDSVGMKNGIEEGKQEEIRCFEEHYIKVDSFVSQSSTTIYNYRKELLTVLGFELNG